jgi:hypothetical protein
MKKHMILHSLYGLTNMKQMKFDLNQKANSKQNTKEINNKPLQFYRQN